ncbi:hypothetical protein BUALT_Bualt17G0002400 [Buddleja alternifolia]|uniref:RING-type domain-containing protein n=1 Tax=Buddleja alternifolia TaxID=168488 RepID=A0AAV6WCT5_9LAMI|nr:hypothetical protein BUALT_Bualt17G0002400 [Buddleja alternifolia]
MENTNSTTNVKADDDSNNTNANTNTDAEENPSNDGDGNTNNRRRTPFTDLSQVDADLALARTLQEQERAYMMLRIDGGDGSDYGSWEAESYGHDDEAEEDDYDDASEEDNDGSNVGVGDDDEGDASDHHAQAQGVQNVELDPSAFSSDEAYARALQDAEEREMAARMLMLAGINEMIVGEDEDEEERSGDSQDAWEEVDPDELSYEELLALGDVVGTESRGLSAETISSLPSINYTSQGIREGSSDSCVICRLDYEDGDTLTVLSCKHSYHSECINNWLQINKVCPVCSAEVSTSGKS